MTSNLYFTDLNFLNKYFSTREFDFINDVPLGNQNLDKLIDKETKVRDTIVEFINNLDSSAPQLDASVSSISLLTELQDIFNKINDNLKMMNKLKIDFSKIFEKIVNLLIKIESSKDQPEIYYPQIQEIKEMINSYTKQNNETKSKITLNDIKIDAFLKRDSVKKLFVVFGMEPLNNIEFDFNISQKGSTNNYLKDNSNINKHLNEYSDDIPKENNVLRVSEKANKVYLPYSKSELSLYLEQYPESYHSLGEVVKKEFILPLDYYMKHPVVARFRETYSLIKDRESKSVIDGLKYAFSLMFKYELNPVIIAACKTQEQLENYLDCLNRNKLDEFKDFEIKFEVSMRKK